LSLHSESDEPVESLGVRRPVELPTGDIDAAGDLAPAVGSGLERDGGEAAAADEEPAESDAAVPSEGDAGAKEASADTATPEKNTERDAGQVEALAVTTPPASGDAAGDGMPPDRPKKTVLAAVAIGGAVVLAVPILLIGTGSHHGTKQRSAVAANTVLPDDGQQPGAFTSASPTATPSATPSASAKKKKDKAKASKSAKPTTSAKASPARKAQHQSVSNARPLAGGPPYKSLRLHAPHDIYPGKTVRTNRIALTMQTGGNLVLRNKSNKIIWSTGTHKAGVYAELQTDGNLVLYGGDRQAVWAAGCFGHNDPTMVLQSDGNVVILDNGGHPIWATGTNR
jgi:hypothetical protein